MDKRDLALNLLQEAYEQQMDGDLEAAIALYKRSIKVLPTAEAHTFLGWTYSFQRRYADAIRECQKAIEADPDFGNPYNDIGAYLIEAGRHDEAIPYLKRALNAKRYEAYHYPHYNLGRIYLRQGRWWEALREFEGAVRVAPQDPESRKALHNLRGRLN